MIRLEKERNLVKIYVEGTNGYYTFNVDTCQMLGKKGSPLKQTPLTYEMRIAFREGGTNLYNAIRAMLEYEGCATHKYARYVKAMHGAEKIDALGLPNMRASRDTYAFIEDNFAMFSKYYKLAVDEGTAITSAWLNAFGEYIRWENAKKQLGNHTEFINRVMYDTMTNYGRREYTTEEWGVIVYYLVRGKMWEYTDGKVSRLIDYLDKCRYMKKTPEKVNNFMREWCETERGYQLRKAEYDTARMLSNYELHKKAFEFSYGNYVVVLPSVPQDIVKEGEDMHHCVGGYMQRVINGNDYIVFVRHKDTPDKCYITCEVYTDGRIGQYFLAYDRYISTAEDKAFRDEFAKHLAENW